MKLISFKLHGKMAHFRKFYSNSTALSYYIPPVATIKGILAGLLGMERDSYYEVFSNENCNIAINIASSIKKITQVMNLLKVESLNDLTGAGANRSQYATEWIIPLNIRKEDVCYEIFISHKDDKIFNDILNRICTNADHYFSSAISVALGSAQCLGWISEGKLIDAKKNIANNEDLTIHSSIPKSIIKHLEITNIAKISLMKEESITDFDNERMIKENSKIEIIASGNASPICLKLVEGSIYYTACEKNIVFIR